MTNRIGVLQSIEHFDTAYFGIHRQQATFMDPMQRLILERTFEALIDAGGDENWGNINFLTSRDCRCKSW